MEKIYVCIGSTGEYSDHEEWYVKAFASEDKCKAFVEAVSAEYRKIVGVKDTYHYSNWDENRQRNPLDPDMKIDYTGTNYYMASVPFEE